MYSACALLYSSSPSPWLSFFETASLLNVFPWADRFPTTTTWRNTRTMSDAPACMMALIPSRGFLELEAGKLWEASVSGFFTFISHSRLMIWVACSQPSFGVMQSPCPVQTLDFWDALNLYYTQHDRHDYAPRFEILTSQCVEEPCDRN